METFEFFVYAPTALTYDRSTDSFTFDAGYRHAEDRIKLTVRDDDKYMDGDEKADEIGEDSNQIGFAETVDGTGLAKGNIYAEQFAVLRAPDGTLIWVDRIEIEGTHVGYSPSQELEPGTTYELVMVNDIDNAPGGDASRDNRMTYDQYQAQSVPCFLTGTRLRTPRGLTPVEEISLGDRVKTRDHGWQVVRWCGQRAFRDAPEMPPPIEFTLPRESGNAPPICLSPQHRILIKGSVCEHYFGESEVLVAEKHVLDWSCARKIHPPPDHAYHHLLLDRHELVEGDGVTMERLCLGDRNRLLVPGPPVLLRKALASGHRTTARLCLRAREAAIFKPFGHRLLAPSYVDQAA